MEKELLEAYHRIFVGRGNEPSWAVHKVMPGRESELVHCPIPFIGRNYSSQKTKVLVYASVENLSHYDGYLDDDEFAINRHRNFFNASALKPELFFPQVHMRPMDNGYLVVAALYVYLKYQNVDQITPAEFLERIAFANYCKYTIQPDPGSKQNQDYATVRKKLKMSREYIVQELKLFCPNIIIMPESIYRTERAFIDEYRGDAVIMPIYQLNARNINHRKRIRRYAPADAQSLHPMVLDWYRHLKKNRTRDNYLSVFTYLDGIMREIEL